MHSMKHVITDCQMCLWLLCKRLIAVSCVQDVRSHPLTTAAIDESSSSPGGSNSTAFVETAFSELPFILQELLEVSEGMAQERLLAAWAPTVGPLGAVGIEVATGIKRPFATAMHGDVALHRRCKAPMATVTQLIVLGSTSGHLLRLSLAIRHPQPPPVAPAAVASPPEDTTHAQATLLGLPPPTFTAPGQDFPAPLTAQSRPLTRLRMREQSKGLDAENPLPSGLLPLICGSGSNANAVLDAALTQAVSSNAPFKLGSEAVHLAVATGALGGLTVTVRGSCGATASLRPVVGPRLSNEANGLLASACMRMTEVARAHPAPSAAAAVAALPSTGTRGHSAALVTAAAGGVVSVLPRCAPLIPLDAASLGLIVHGFFVGSAGRVTATFVHGVVPLVLRGCRGCQGGVPVRARLQQAGPPLYGTCIAAGEVAPNAEVLVFSDRAAVLCAASDTSDSMGPGKRGGGGGVFLENAHGEWRPGAGGSIVAGAVVTGAVFVVVSHGGHGQQLSVLLLNDGALHCRGALMLKEHSAAAVAACQERFGGWLVATAAWGGMVLMHSVVVAHAQASVTLLCNGTIASERAASAVLQPESIMVARVLPCREYDLDEKYDVVHCTGNSPIPAAKPLTIGALLALGTRDGHLTLAAMCETPKGSSIRSLVPLATVTVGERPVRVCSARPADTFVADEWRLVVASGCLTAIAVHLDAGRLASLVLRCPLGPLDTPVDTFVCLGPARRITASGNPGFVIAVATGAATGSSTATAAAFAWPLPKAQTEARAGFMPRVAPLLPPPPPPAITPEAACAHTVFVPLSLRGHEWLLVAQTPYTSYDYVGPATLAVLLPQDSKSPNQSSEGSQPSQLLHTPSRTWADGSDAWHAPLHASQSPAAHLRMSPHATDAATDPMSPQFGHTLATTPLPQRPCCVDALADTLQQSVLGGRILPQPPIVSQPQLPETLESSDAVTINAEPTGGGTKNFAAGLGDSCVHMDCCTPALRGHTLWASEPEQEIVSVAPWAPCGNHAGRYASLWSTAPASGVFAALQAGHIAETFVALGLNVRAVSTAAAAASSQRCISEVVVLGVELRQQISGGEALESVTPTHAHTLARCYLSPHKIGAVAASSTSLYVAAGSHLCGIRLARQTLDTEQRLFHDRSEPPLSLVLERFQQGRMPSHATALTVDDTAGLLLAMDAEHSVCIFRCVMRLYRARRSYSLPWAGNDCVLDGVRPGMLQCELVLVQHSIVCNGYALHPVFNGDDAFCTLSPAAL
jgi:hypothetical protein